MKTRLKRALAAVGVVAVVAGVAPILMATPAFAAGSPQSPGATINNPGGAGLKQNGGGTSAGNFTLRLPAGAACPGDGLAGWAVDSFIAVSTVDPSTLAFDGLGQPTTSATGVNFVQALRDAAGNPAQASLNVGDGAVINIPNMSFSSFSLGDFDTTVTRVYNLGLACVQGGAMNKFWAVQMTVTPDATATGGTPQIHWENGTAPAAPTLTSAAPAAVIPATGQVSVAFTNAAANPALTGCTLFVGTSAGGTQFSGAGGTPVSCTSPAVVNGLTYGTQYFFRLAATSSVGTSAQSNELSATPVRPAVTGLTATPSPNNVAVDWADAPLLGADSYNVAVCTGAVAPCTAAAGAAFVGNNNTGSTSAFNFAGTSGTLYSFTVTYGAAGSSLAANTSGTPLSNSILIQDVTVTRPNGALVLTQRCGVWSAMPAEGGVQIGFPTGLPASPASVDQVGTAPTTGAAPGGPADGQFPQYPYPVDANDVPNPVYPTHCALALGNAHFVTSGGSAAGQGQFFATSGRLNEVTVVDTREDDPGWTVNMQASPFSAGPGKSFTGDQIGWTLLTGDTAAFDDADPATPTYDQTVTAGSPMVANTIGGAGSPHAVASAPTTQGLGIATIDARIKVLIPVFEKNGTYAGTLTLSAV